MSRRRNKRGAAMVEAAVVLPVLISFLGLTMMMYRGYAEKLDKNQQIRSSTLDYASHACQSQKISYSGNGTGTSGSSVGGVNPGQSNANDVLSQNGANAATTSGFMNKASVNYSTRTIVNPKPNTATKGTGLTLRVNGATSTALCNEVPRDGNFTGFFGYIKNVLTGSAS